MVETDKYGFQYYSELPDNAKLANIWHFITIDREEFDYYKPKIGMEYLIQSQDESRYYIHKLSKYIEDKDLLNYIHSEQIFILS